MRAKTIWVMLILLSLGCAGEPSTIEAKNSSTAPQREPGDAVTDGLVYSFAPGPSDVAPEAGAARGQAVAWSMIESIALREEARGLAVGAGARSVTAEILLSGDLADRFVRILQSDPEQFLWVLAGGGRRLDALPVAYAVRPGPQRDQVWVAAGVFGSRAAAESFFAQAGNVPSRFTALSEADGAAMEAENARLVQYGIWLSVCDAAALAELGDGLTAALEALPDAARQRAGVNCEIEPRLGAGKDLVEDIRR